MTADSDARHGVTIDIVPTTAIAPPTWDEIWRLTQTFYDTDRDYMLKTLSEHQRIILFRSRDERALIGMASVDLYPAMFRGRRLAVLFTSHVVILEQYRGHNLIQRAGLRLFLEARLRFLFRPIYWFFDTFSYKSYLLLPRNFREFWPRFDRETPEWERALMDQLAARTYGAAWRPAQGIAARSGRKRLRPDAAPLEEKLAGIPEIEFYVRANPGHAEGDMLVCLCPLTAGNWLSVAIQALKRSRRSTISSP